MATVNFERPSSLDEAATILANANGNAKVMAGGTDLLVQMHAGAIAPQLIVDLKEIPELKRIEETVEGFVVGAAVSGAELEEHESLKKEWPGVVEAVNLIGSTQIQGRASPGGNLCNGSPAADSVPAMIAAGAVCSILGPNGRRELPVENMITGPGQNALEAGEILVSIKLPKRPPHSGDAYLRLIPRTEMDIAVVGAGVSLTLDDQGICTAARVALGAVAATPLLVQEAGEALVGSKVDAAALEKVAAAASAACKPIDDKRGTIEYRTEVAGVLARRAAIIAAERAR